MSDFESHDPAGSSQEFLSAPRPPALVSARRSSRLASRHATPSPSSQLIASGIMPGSDQDISQLVQLTDLLPLDSPSNLPPPPPSSRKRSSKTANPPAKRRRGRPPSTTLPASSLPGSSAAVSAPPLDSPTPQASHSTAPLIPDSFLTSLDSLQQSIALLTQHL
ncbi:hypothetical protein CHARACLAT_010089 [Characodon lateralis]|uniref:Uncharacterized protein n=1 Tax=Characodon lateralis TaxID=208331 RepID=A0ABU7CQ63_9TELE|nr:hypothetical protein [Characodon lateralis]